MISSLFWIHDFRRSQLFPVSGFDERQIFDKRIIFSLLRFRCLKRFVDEGKSKLQCICMCYMYIRYDIHMSYIHKMYLIDPSDQALLHLLAWPPWAVPVELEL